jgi:hypothetical protein
MNEAARYFVLIAPAVTFLLALSQRQARISVIARENAKQIIAFRALATEVARVTNLRDQNRLLLARYRLIQWALLVICVGLVILGIHAFTAFFAHEILLLVAGVAGMGVGTAVILYEIARAGDTLRHEVAFCEWITEATPGTPAPKMKRWTLVRRK